MKVGGGMADESLGKYIYIYILDIGRVEIEGRDRGIRGGDALVCEPYSAGTDHDNGPITAI